MSGPTSPIRRSSRSRSRARTRSPSPVYFPTPDMLPDGPILEDNAEIIDDFIHHRPHVHQTEEIIFEADGDDEEDDHDAVLDEQREQRKRMPWWKRATPWWYILSIPFSAIATGSTLTPKIAVVTGIVCESYKRNRDHSPDWDSERTALSIAPYSIGVDTPRAFVASSEHNDFTIATLFPVKTNETEFSVDHPIVCASDPTVQAGVAKVLAWMSTTTGILSCFTTGFWGSLSDRRGRTFVICFALFGLFFQDLNFLAVTHFPDRVPGGYNTLLLGSLVEGLFGGQPTSVATIHAYLADCSTTATRSHTFSRFLGMLFIGMTLGPTLGSIIIRATGNIMSVFYIGATIHLITLFLNLLVVPESLFPAQMALSRQKYMEEIKTQRREVGWFARVKRLFGFLSPLTILAPVHVDSTGTASSRWLRKGKWDWSLTFTAIAYGATVMLLGSAQTTFQYASAQFGWSTEMLGYFLSTIAISRAVFLSVVLPYIIKYFKPKPPSIQLPLDPSEPLNSPSRPSATRSISRTSRSKSTSRTRTIALTRSVEDHDHPHHTHATTRFDLTIARLSIFIEIVVYLGLPLFGAVGFLALSALGSLGAGFSPTVQSLALEFYRKRGGTETGKLYGGLSIVSALCSAIIGPAMFGYIYIGTVATFPQAYLYAGLLLTCISFIMLLCVRVPPLPGLEDLEDIPEEDEGEEIPGGARAVIPEIVVDDVDAGDERSGGRNADVETVGEGSVVRM